MTSCKVCRKVCPGSMVECKCCNKKAHINCGILIPADDLQEFLCINCNLTQKQPITQNKPHPFFNPRRVTNPKKHARQLTEVINVAETQIVVAAPSTTPSPPHPKKRRPIKKEQHCPSRQNINLFFGFRNKSKRVGKDLTELKLCLTSQRNMGSM